MDALENIQVLCPYCGESFDTVVDTSSTQQNYVEDCQICCSPIVFDIEIDPESDTLHYVTRQENE